MGRKLRTTIGDLAEELRNRGYRDQAAELDRYRNIGSLPRDSDDLVMKLADMITGRR